MHTDCYLVDGWQRHREAPSTFEVPSTRELMALKPNQYVKLAVEGFKSPGGIKGERFWVSIVELSQPIVGIVEQSDMLFTRYHGVANGDTILFEPRHILGIYDGN